MPTPATSLLSAGEIDALLGQLARAFEESLGLMTGLSCTVAQGDALDTHQIADRRHWRQGFQEGVHGVACLAASSQTWRWIAERIGQLTGDIPQRDDDWRNHCSEVCAQAVSKIVEPLSAKLNRRTTLAQGRFFDEDADSVPWSPFILEMPGTPAMPVDLGLLVTQPPLTSVVEAEVKFDPLRKPEGPATSLDLLMEVELPVSVSFGRTQMKLKDATRLSTGSIVELNKALTEPVEIIVNNCVIARGEVVVIEGNYGVRIKEIVSREERLRTLF